ncbi:hypothetical protein D3C73_1470030 [compost metagenome]
MFIISVAVGPGLTLFTRILRGASSIAAMRITALSADLPEEYIELLAAFILAVLEDRKTTEAPSFSKGINLLSVK